MKTMAMRWVVVGLLLGLTGVVIAPASASADPNTPHHIVVTQAAGTGRLTDEHTFTVRVLQRGATDAIDAPVVGATVDLSWVGGPGSLIVEVNGGAVTPPAPTASCTTSGTGRCTVIVSSPDDVGQGTLTATYDVPNPGPQAVPFPTGGDEGTNCIAPQIVSGTIQSCPGGIQDVVSIRAIGVGTWYGYVVDVDPDAVNPLGVSHDFTVAVNRSDGTPQGSTPAVGVIANFTWTGVAGSTVTHVNGTPSPGALSCVTDGAGQCIVRVNSIAPGGGELEVGSVVGALVPPVPARTETPSPSSDLTATKEWIDWRVLLTPPQDVNLLGDQHVFTATLERNDGSGWTTDTRAGNQIVLGWSGVPGSTITSVSAGTVTSPTAATCNTNAAGQCTITVNTTAVGSGTLTATIARVSIPGYAPPNGQAGALFDYDVPDVAGNKTWVRFFGNVTPTGTNLVGEDHVFTITATHDKGLGPQFVPNGSVVRFTWTGTGSIAPATSCTIQAGTCTVTASSNATGTGTIRLTSVTATIDNVTFTNAPISAAANGGRLTATKTWVDYRLRIDPPNDTNLIDTEHVFTVTVERDSGNGFVPLANATPTITRTGVGRVTSNGCAAGTATDGTCRVVTTSPTPGDMTVTATFIGSAGGKSVTLTDRGNKTWVNYRLTLTPREAINDVGDPHVFVAKLEEDRGAGFRVAGGKTLSLSSTGVGSIINIQPAGPRSRTCTTDSAGTCRITVNSNVPGSLKLTATFDAIVGATSGTFTAQASKGWIPPEELPRTGSSSAPMLRGGFGLLALGGILLLASRRRTNLT